MSFALLPRGFSGNVLALYIYIRQELLGHRLLIVMFCYTEGMRREQAVNMAKQIGFSPECIDEVRLSFCKRVQCSS